jgi:hypothetical protein
LVPQQNWVQVQALALGTTTIHDPSNRASEIFAAKEMQQAGSYLGPRIFSTGEIVYGAKSARVFAETNNLDDALAHVRRLKAQGALSVKNYNQPRRDQRQQVIEAGRREGMQVVAEGGSLYGLGITHILDGNATFGLFTLTSVGDENVFVAKVDPSGGWMWATQAGGSSGDYGRGISALPDGSSIVTGSFDGTATFGSTTLTGAGIADVFVAKFLDAPQAPAAPQAADGFNGNVHGDS